MENVNNIPDQKEVPSNIKKSEQAKLVAVSYLLEELRQMALKKADIEKFYLTLGYAEGTVQRMLQSSEGDEFDWLGNVTERVEKFKKVETSGRMPMSDLLDSLSTSSISPRKGFL
ncbi:hypothetical protein [Runella sp. SP2]|uniref:hypothetical protein n=1 Tax=Runella sp. SP2 TaxID=2268026 RepID=UPI000F08AFFC|nr:hypothetical protein [Runella sp. SP2]AYQ31408.1 hypothetical protein DTQ70_04085 [Runella sp. SP2]